METESATPRLVQLGRSVLQLALPPRCLLCGAAGQAHLDLCPGCAADLPRNACACAHCALPLAQAAPACGACQRRPPPWAVAWAPFRYAWPLNLLETRFKFSASLACGRTLAAAWVAAGPPPVRPGCIVPVPLHARRLRERGYNQALELARPLARAWALPLATGALRRVRATPAQSRLDGAARRRNLRGAFVVRSGSLPAHVALVDDVMTTGATLAECTRTLQRAGVRRVDVWALARTP